MSKSLKLCLGGVERRTYSLSVEGNSRKKYVLLVISLAGIKVCSPDGKIVHMAHALRRISYATCDPEHRLFSFLAREPKGHFNQQYCHSFISRSPEQVGNLAKKRSVLVVPVTTFQEWHSEDRRGVSAASTASTTNSPTTIARCCVQVYKFNAMCNNNKSSGALCL
ncbi:hypothetical protein TcasGA2_TC032084 [Tribolium castaneum]|uniref:PID domain-containing protein n=1 Tax=Tribolium castaneum TaxID=7070 RepID=A0A139WMD5_TRICA|nr:hypothetical protein TcasGA2_TC032084 [Tribolium castaneum]